MRNRIVIFTFFILTFLLQGSALSFAGEHVVDPREMAIDRAVGGMEAGSRMLSPESGAGEERAHEIPGKGLSPSTDTRVTASGAGAPSALPAQPTESGSSAMVTPPSQVESTETPIVELPTVETPPIEETLPIENIVEEPIVQQPILEIPPIEETPIVETLPIESHIEEIIQEPAGGETDRSIIEVDIGANLSGDEISVDADVSIEPEAEGGLLDVQADTTTDIVQEELTTETGLQVDIGQNTTTAETALGTATGTTNSPPSGEVEAGLEADVEGTGAGDDVSSDAADGLSGL